MDEQTLRRNTAIVRERIARAAERAGRSPGQVRLMAVTKTLPLELGLMAAAAGITLFGENRVQEAVEKWSAVPPGAELHLIGHLQRNKAKAAAGVFSCVHSIDKLETARALSAACAAAGRTCDILLEVNTSGEDSKGGVRDRGALMDLLAEVAGLGGVRVRGLMTVGPLTEDQAAVRRAFAELRALLEEARRQPAAAALDVLSMGMSGDFEVAVEEGSTLVRLGTALFGPRPRG